MKNKKILTLAIAAMLSVAVLTGCGCSKNNGTSGSSTNSSNVDINKVESTVSLTAPEADYHAELGDVEVTIGDAKIIEYNGEDLAVVEFVYKNNGSEPMPFTGAFDVVGTQDDRTLTPWVVDNYEGISMESLTQPAQSGEQLNIQKAFRIKDKENPIEIDVFLMENGVRSPEGVAKTFSFE